MPRLLAAVALGIGLSAGTASGQNPTLTSADATRFIGTWIFTMSNPPGAEETVRVRDDKGRAAASVQAGRFPPIPVSGMLIDGDMLVLTATRFENGQPIRAVISLIPRDGAMEIAQMLEFSETITRGQGRRE